METEMGDEPSGDQLVELLNDAQNGNEESAAEIARLVVPWLRECVRIPAKWRSLIEVDDVVQITLVEVLLGLTQLRQRTTRGLRAWATTVAKNNLRDSVRGLEAQSRFPENRRLHDGHEDSVDGLIDRLLECSDTASRWARRAQEREALLAAVEELPPTYRSVVQLYDLELLSIDEVQQTVGKSRGALYMIRARAHEMLSRALVEHRPSDPL